MGRIYEDDARRPSYPSAVSRWWDNSRSSNTNTRAIHGQGRESESSCIFCCRSSFADRTSDLPEAASRWYGSLRKGGALWGSVDKAPLGIVNQGEHTFAPLHIPGVRDGDVGPSFVHCGVLGARDWTGCRSSRLPAAGSLWLQGATSSQVLRGRIGVVSHKESTAKETFEVLLAGAVLPSVLSASKSCSWETRASATYDATVVQSAVNRHRTVMNIFDKKPEISDDAFVAPSAAVIGDVQIGEKSSIWYGCVIRGDVNYIRVGSQTNIQDNTLVHVAKTNVSGNIAPTIIGDKVTVGSVHTMCFCPTASPQPSVSKPLLVTVVKKILSASSGHNAVLHACTVEDEAFVGMGATLLDGVVVETGAMVAAGALVTQNTRIPAGQVWAGNPAKFLRNLSAEERAFIGKSADNYAQLGAAHAEENAKSSEQIEADKERRKKVAQQSDDYDSHLGIVREKHPDLAFPDKSGSRGPH